MNKTFLVVLLALVVISSSVAVFAPRVSACWWLFGCNPTPPTPAPVKAPVCAPGTHRCTNTASGCTVEDCVGGSWVKFRTTAGACEVIGVQPSCHPSRINR